MGWFFGFKLHLIVNHLGDILSVKMTGGNIDDSLPIPFTVTPLSGILQGDTGYLLKALSEELLENRVELVTNVKNIKKKVMTLLDKVIAYKAVFNLSD